MYTVGIITTCGGQHNHTDVKYIIISKIMTKNIIKVMVIGPGFVS